MHGQVIALGNEFRERRSRVEVLKKQHHRSGLRIGQAGSIEQALALNR